ncbi:MAG: hypothetical protein ACXWD8_03415 [Mycobacterium sp.]
MAVSPDGNHLYVTNDGGDSVSVISVSPLKTPGGADGQATGVINSAIAGKRQGNLP